MAQGSPNLTGDDLARPAKQLPLKVIRELGRKLHRQLPTSGNWETLAEDLGYGFEDIQQFTSLARHEITPGETMLLNWVQRGNGCTLFVLRSALLKADRHDCVEYLETELYDKVVCMDLMFCIKDETTKQIDHRSVRTRSDISLIDSLRNVLDEPIGEQYDLLDRNVSWVHTLTREFKGRELMLMKKSTDMAMEQDPTIDSSNPSLGVGNKDNYFENNELQFNRVHPARRPIISQYNSPHWTRNTHESGTFSRTSAKVPSNDLGQDTGEQRQNCNMFYPNIQQTERNALNTTVNVSSEPFSSNRDSSALNSCVSDELNANYPVYMSDKDFPVGKLRVVDENTDSSNEDFDVIAYQDPSSAVYGSNLTADEQTCRTGIHGIDGDYLSDTTVQVCSTIPNDISMTNTNILDDKERCSQRNGACYEDSEADKNVDHPVYHYARELSFERDDSVTRIKRIAQNEFNRQSKMEENTISQERQVTYGAPAMRHVMTNREVRGDNISHSNNPFDNVYNCKTFEEEPVYTENESMIYKDFETTHSVRTSDRTRESLSFNRESLTYPSKVLVRNSKDDECPLSEETFVKSTIADTDYPEYKEPFPSDIESPNNIGNGVIDSDTNIHENRGHGKVSRQSVNRGVLTTNRQRERLDSGYIDFNNFPQTGEFPTHHVEHDTCPGDETLLDRNQQSDVVAFQKSRSTHFQVDSEGGTLKRVRFANRCMSQFESTPSQYESLNRQLSCPNFDYASTMNSGSSLNTDFSTIAEAFSPSTDESIVLGNPVEEFDRECQMQEQSDSPQSYPPERQINGKRNSYPGTSSAILSDKSKFARHSMPLMRNMSNSRPLPEIPFSDRVSNTGSVRTSGSFSSHSEGVSDDPYKIVVGGKTSRTMVDSCLANDKLFMHYNTELRGHTGWSPKENEYTIDKTMADVLQENGLYILWYHRSKKNLIITVTHAGDLLHFRVRQKVVDKRLYFLVNRLMVLPDVKELLQYHHVNGLPVERQQAVRMRLPVCVKYDRIPIDV